MAGVLKEVLGIEWRNEKDDAVLHQILLCLKALSTTEVCLRKSKKANGRLGCVSFQNHQPHYSPS